MVLVFHAKGAVFAAEGCPPRFCVCWRLVFFARRRGEKGLLRGLLFGDFGEGKDGRYFVCSVALLVACSYSSFIDIKCVKELERYSWCSSAVNGSPFLLPRY